MAEQTHSKIKQIEGQEKYLEDLRDSEAYKLLRVAFLKGLFSNDKDFNHVIAIFLDTGRIEGGKFERSYYLNGI